MSNPTLASEADVVSALGRALTSEEALRVPDMLVKASDLFRGRAGQLFTPGTSTVRLKVNGGEVRLAQSPATTVLAVTDDDGTAVEFTRFEQVLTVQMRSHEFVRVTYEHGADEVPDLVRTTVADVVARVLSIDPAARAGFTQVQETTGPFSNGGTFAAHAVGGQVMLAPADITTALTFRPPRTGGTIVQRP